MHAHRAPPNQLKVLVAMIATLAATAVLPGAPAVAADGQTFVSYANQKRQAPEHGLAAVAWHAAIDQIAVERGNQMAANDAMAHDLPYVQRRMSELGVCFTGYGEIIYWERGYATFDPWRAVQAWYDSAAHKAIMLGSYNAAAGSWTKNQTSKGIFAVMIFVNVCGSPAPTSGDPAESVRVAGADRYATAAALSAVSYQPGVAVAFVATGANFPDALAAGPAAARAGGPVLLIKQNEIPPATASELARLRPGRIVVLGGSAVISDWMVQVLRQFTPSGQVARLAGADRYATAALISQTHFSQGVPVAYVATGANFPDALAGGALAGAQGGPILLVKQNEVPGPTAAELWRLRPARIVMLGSTAVISDAVGLAMGGMTGATVIRLAGSDRYSTAVKVSQSKYAANEPSTVFVATGASFPDGLAGSPVAGSLPGPLLLVPKSSLPSTVAAELQRLAPERVVVLGGSGAISDEVVWGINAVVP
jgi:putative cell wall-binding protein/uncharacterized protein YkwD